MCVIYRTEIEHYCSQTLQKKIAALYLLVIIGKSSNGSFVLNFLPTKKLFSDQEQTGIVRLNDVT